jgi:radical SAM protein with 4Fe4S-binding SPASM domain
MCPTGLDVLTRRKGRMDLDGFARLLDQVERTVVIMTFWGWGESSLHPDLFRMIRLAHDRGVITMLTLNGTKLEADALIDSGLDYLVVSFDGLTEEAYAPVRRGGDLEAAKAGIRALADAKRRRGVEHPRANMGFIVTRLNEHQVPGLLEAARAIGFDGARPKYLHVATRQNAEELRPRDPRLRGEVGIKGPGRSIEKDIPGVVKLPVPDGCGLLWHYSMVYWDGTMVPCCYDWDAEQKLGNAFHDDFRALWHGPLYREFRRKVMHEKQTIGLCKECNGGDVMVFFSDTFLLRP